MNASDILRRMNTIMSERSLARLEAVLERLIEGGLARLFAARLNPQELSSRLARALEDNVRYEQGHAYAPTRFLVGLHPDDHAAIVADQVQLTASLADHIVQAAVQLSLTLHRPPTVEFVVDAALTPMTIHVQAMHPQETRRATKRFSPVQPDADTPHDAPRNAQLVVNGSRYIPLNRHVINIGRRKDNHIVIDDPRISRAHAQIRLRFGKFVLFDLGSKAGTYINEQKITQHTLKPGDVISLAGVMLVYVEDEATNSMTAIRRTDETQPKVPPQDN